MTTNIKQPNLNWLMILFLPLILSFTLPLLFYQFPIQHYVFNRKVEFTSSDILHATIVWVTWIGIAVTTPLLLSRIKNSNGSERHWSLPTIWRGFVVLSVICILISPLQYFFSFNSGIEQLLQQLSFAPVVAVVVGIRAIQDINSSDERQRHLRLLVCVLLLSLNSAIALVLPVLMGRAAPAVYAGIAILYGLHALKIERKRQIAIWLVFVMFAGLAMSFKSNFRTSSLGSAFWYHGQYIRIPIKDVLNLGMLEAHKKAWLKKVDSYHFQEHEATSHVRQDEATSHVRQEVDKLVDGYNNFYAPKSLSLADDSQIIFNYTNFDLNYQSIRFISENYYIPEKVKYLVAKTLNRINHLGDLTIAIKLTPDSIPYLNGSTYYPLLFKPIPRLLWKDKPEDNSGQIYGHRYGALAPTDMTTSANMGVVIEAWINGGWLVLVLSSFTFGIMIYLVWRNLIGESGEIGNIVLGTVFVASGLATESSMNLVMGGMFYVVLVWWFIEYNIRTKL